ncbi:MAG: carboxypeptidase [Micromonosporaceae bacterium]|nr:carboxypeptidase [Micromonosporaceae bacterium]
MFNPFTLRRGRVALAAAAVFAVWLSTSAGATETADPAPIQLVSVDTPTRDHKLKLQTLGLDLTERADRDSIDVVLYNAADVATLREAGFTWTVQVPDLALRLARVNKANKAYAAANDESPLPSGQNRYRKLDDYNDDLRRIPALWPDLAKRITLPQKSLEGKTIYGVELGKNVNAPEDGRPVFVMLGLHHAREWPSGEHAIEFAYDLAKNYGKDQRITDLLNTSRVIIVPVANPDGFQKSVDDGHLIDLREVDDGGTASILGTPGNAYKRKNCRIVDGQEPAAGECAAGSPGGFGAGIDTNRNYGGLWGGPGASDNAADPTYRGAGPFSEPETQAVRELVSGRQVTTLITNHTFSNLVLRPNGVAPDTIGPDGEPVGNAPDEAAMKALGDRMAAQNGYTSQHGWELYDTTGTTEDWSYNATGGFGYTFEIGPDEFHPPYEKVVGEYLGAGEYAGKGNREAFLIALENAVDATTHSMIAGKAPAGATLRLKKSFATPTWEGSIKDTLDTTMKVGSNGKYTWHVNPSTRPIVQKRQVRLISGDPLKQETYSGTTLPSQQTDQEFVVDQDADILEVKLDWPTPDDMDLYVYRKAADGTLTEVGSSTSFVTEKERVLLQNPEQGTYVLRVENFASVTPTWDLTASLFNGEDKEVGDGLIETWTLTCEQNGTVLQRIPVIVDRGQQVKADLKTCLSKWATA